MTVNDTHADINRVRSRHIATTPSESAPERAQPTPSAASNAALGGPIDAPRGRRRERVRSKPGLGHAYRVGVFVAGLLFIVLGFGLAVLPGPLTIPPVLIGLWIWSTEFRFAQRLFDSFKRNAREAWQHAKAHRISSTAITAGGLVAAGTAAWAISHFEIVAKGREAIGM
jgi:hypothetical protein